MKKLLIFFLLLFITSCSPPPKPSIYEGECTEGNCFDGKGTLLFADEDKIYYKGEFKKGQLDGKGIMSSDGQVYKGKFKGGEHYGKGSITYFDKSQEIGEWKSGEFIVTQKVQATEQKKTETSEGEEAPFGDEDIALQDSWSPEQDEVLSDEEFTEQEDFFSGDSIVEESDEEEAPFGDEDFSLEAATGQEDFFSGDSITEEPEKAVQ